jgi:phospholipase/carboxylesterase
VLLSHGRQDPVVPYEASEALRDQLQAAGAGVELLAFDGGHAIDPDLFPAIRRFLSSCWA